MKFKMCLFISMLLQIQLCIGVLSAQNEPFDVGYIKHSHDTQIGISISNDSTNMWFVMVPKYTNVLCTINYFIPDDELVTMTRSGWSPHQLYAGSFYPLIEKTHPVYSTVMQSYRFSVSLPTNLVSIESIECSFLAIDLPTLRKCTSYQNVERNLKCFDIIARDLYEGKASGVKSNCKDIGD